MQQEKAVLQTTTSGVLLQVRVQPRARVERVEGVQGERLRLRLTAPPVDGAANTACIALLAKTLGLSRAQVQLQSGMKSRDKLVHITGMTLPEVAAALAIPLT